MKYLIYSIVSILLISGCMTENKIKIAQSITVSTDTLFFDTVFTEKGSYSRRLTVYNKGIDDIIIPKIGINNTNTFYKLLISGVESNIQNNVSLLAGDSLLILASVYIDPSDVNLPFIINDSIEFKLSNESSYVNLVSWGQNAHYLSDSILSCNATFTADKPYVIYNSILVDSLCTLNIEAGAKIYSHNNSAIYIKGSINSIGTADNRITFSNDRFDGNYQNYAGQWEGIYFLEGSKNNILEYTDIKNARIGLRVGTPDDDVDWDLVMNQCTVQNTLAYGLLAFTSDVKIVNTAILQSGIRGIGFLAGGNYEVVNSTIYNYDHFQFRKEALVLISDNVLLADNSLLTNNSDAIFENTLIWGDLSEEIQFSKSDNTVFNTSFNNNLLKSLHSDFNSTNIINTNPALTVYQNLPIMPDSNSPLINSGIENGIIIDLLGKNRDLIPDIGALEYIP